MKLIIVLIMLFLTIPAAAANTSRNFGGIGIDGAPWADGRIVVKQLVVGGPAELAGIKRGDIITHIDGKPTEGSDFRDMVEHRLRGKAGTPIIIVVKRPANAKLVTFKLIRRQLVIQPRQ